MLLRDQVTGAQHVVHLSRNLIAFIGHTHIEHTQIEHTYNALITLNRTYIQCINHIEHTYNALITLNIHTMH